MVGDLDIDVSILFSKKRMKLTQTLYVEYNRRLSLEAEPHILP